MSFIAVSVDDIKASWYKRRGEPGYDPAADLNDDGVVNGLDLFIFAKISSGGVATPETTPGAFPAAPVALAGAGGLVLLLILFLVLK